VQEGISKDIFVLEMGIVPFTGDGPGIDRGGINWNGVCYRVMGTSLVSIDSGGIITSHGTIPGSDLVRFDYSFDYLAIRASGALFLYNGALIQITDADLGHVC
jgi:hypothetical protein